MKKRVWIVTLAVAALTLSGCATTAGTGTTTAPETGTNQPPASKAAPGKAAPAPAPAPSDATTKFGGSYKWEDGLQVTVSKSTAFKPSDTSMGGGKNNVVFTVTILNKTGKKFDPSMFNSTMQSANEESEQIFDSAKKIGGSPDTSLLNGREVKFKVAFNVLNPKDLVLEVSPSFEHESTIFQL